jgi:hypothetical protein
MHIRVKQYAKKPEHHVNNTKIFSLYLKTQRVSSVKIRWLILFKEMIAVNFEH